MFISIRSAASCGQPLHEMPVPRGARIGAAGRSAGEAISATLARGAVEYNGGASAMPILNALIVLSLAFPDELKIIFPVVVSETFLTLILRFPVGEMIYPDSAITNPKLAPPVVAKPLARIAAPSER